MKTTCQHAIQRAIAIIALASVMTIAVQATIARQTLASSQSVSFQVSDPAIGFSATISTNVAWNSEQSVKKGYVATIAYTLTSNAGSASVTVPLSQLDQSGLLGLKDQTVTVPLPGAPLGSTSVSLTQLLVGVPSTVASVDLVLIASIQMAKMTTTSSSIDMLTDINGLVWTSWGSKSVQLLTSDKVDATVRATLEYAISVGVTATMLGQSYPLVPSTPIAGVSGSPDLATHISVSDNSTLLLMVGIGGAAGCGVAVIAFFLLRRRSKKDGTKKSDGNQKA
jgi:hypothetical protein